MAIAEGHFPPEIVVLIGQTFLFKVETKADFSPRFEQSFSVRKICTVPDIIQEFMKKWEGEEASFSKQTMEASSLSVLLDKGKTPLMAGSSNVLIQDDISLSETVDKFKAKIVGECSGVVTQHLLPRFVVAECEPLVVEISQKSSSSSKRESPTKDEDDMNIPLKMLKKTVKIEKP